MRARRAGMLALLPVGAVFRRAGAGRAEEEVAAIGQLHRAAVGRRRAVLGLEAGDDQLRCRREVRLAEAAAEQCRSARRPRSPSSRSCRRAAFTSMYTQPCGLTHSIFVSVPCSVTGLLTSNSAENEWCAADRSAARQEAPKGRYGMMFDLAISLLECESPPRAAPVSASVRACLENDSSCELRLLPRQGRQDAAERVRQRVGDLRGADAAEVVRAEQVEHLADQLELPAVAECDGLAERGRPDGCSVSLSIWLAAIGSRPFSARQALTSERSRLRLPWFFVVPGT